MITLTVAPADFGGRQKKIGFVGWGDLDLSLALLASLGALTPEDTLRALARAAWQQHRSMVLEALGEETLPLLEAPEWEVPLAQAVLWAAGISDPPYRLALALQGLYYGYLFPGELVAMEAQMEGVVRMALEEFAGREGQTATLHMHCEAPFAFTPEGHIQAQGQVVFPDGATLDVGETITSSAPLLTVLYIGFNAGVALAARNGAEVG